MNNIKYLLILSVFAVFLFAKQKDFTAQEEIVISANNGTRPVVIQNNSSDMVPQNREEINLWVDDFEEDLGWSLGSGWEWSTADYNSETHSMHSGNTDSNGSFDLVSPVIELPSLGDGETMAFGFYLFADLPDSDGDGDGYLEDYYAVSIMDVADIAWQVSDFNGTDGNNYWCGKDDIGNGSSGYLDAWVQYLDTPSISIGDTSKASNRLSVSSGISVSGDSVETFRELITSGATTKPSPKSPALGPPVGRTSPARNVL